MDWLYKWLPAPMASSYGADIDGIFRTIYWITFATFLLVMGLLVLFLVVYRDRPGRKAVYSHGNNVLELTWTVIPALILVWLTFESQAIWDRVRGPMPKGDVYIGVSGKQFNWFFYYPGKDGKVGPAGPTGRFDQGDNVEAASLNVPVGKVVRVSLSSQDVIHSFFLPNFRFKQDAVPGRTIEVWFKATKPGIYEVACAELCGFDHANMRAKLTVHDPASWAAWLKQNPKSFPEQGTP